MARKKLGKYEITDRIGRGGMAEVYRGYHVQLDRFVAIKLLHPFLADDPEFKDRFENEARNVAKLKHPNIVQVYDFEYDSEGESYYMVMELINGPTLKDRLFDGSTDGEKVAVGEAIRIIKSAAEALAYAHQHSMIHRDVKPANLMLDDDGRIVLTDFGIAKIVTGTQFTASGGMVGTPAYMAPEQGLGEAGDERSDIYSLGVILFQLVTGRLPFDADTPLAIILKHVNDPIPSPKTYTPDITEDLEQVIFKSLAKEPENRYQTAAEFAADLGQLDSNGYRILQAAGVAPFSAAGPQAPVETSPDAPSAAQRERLLAAVDDSPSLPKPPRRSVGAPTAAVTARPETGEVGAGRLTLLRVMAVIAAVFAIGILGMAGFGNEGTLFGGILDPEGNTSPSSADASGTAVGLLANDNTPEASQTAPTIPVKPPTDTQSPTRTENSDGETPTDEDLPTTASPTSPTATEKPVEPTELPAGKPSATPLPTRQVTATRRAPSVTPQPTAKPTDTPSPQPDTATPTPEPPTITPSPTDTPVTPTVTPSLTRTPSPTRTPTPDRLATQQQMTVVAFFATEAAKSPTPNMTQTLAACDWEYIVVMPTRQHLPPADNDFGSPRLVRSNDDFEFSITLRNTGSCDWPDRLWMDFNEELTADPEGVVDLQIFEAACNNSVVRPGQNFASQGQTNFFFQGEVGVTEDTTPLVFTGTAPTRNGCYYSVWDLLYPVPGSNIVIGRPLVLAIRVWGGSN